MTTVVHVFLTSFRQNFTRYCAQSHVSPNQLKKNQMNSVEDIVLLRFLAAILGKKHFPWNY